MAPMKQDVHGSSMAAAASEHVLAEVSDWVTVSFWFCGGRGSLLGGAGVLGLASGLGADSFSCAPAGFRSPRGEPFFSLLPPVPAALAQL